MGAAVVIDPALLRERANDPNCLDSNLLRSIADHGDALMQERDELAAQLAATEKELAEVRLQLAKGIQVQANQAVALEAENFARVSGEVEIANLRRQLEEAKALYLDKCEQCDRWIASATEAKDMQRAAERRAARYKERLDEAITLIRDLASYANQAVPFVFVDRARAIVAEYYGSEKALADTPVSEGT